MVAHGPRAVQCLRGAGMGTVRGGHRLSTTAADNTRRELTGLLALAAPLVVARLSHVLMGAVDTWMASTLGVREVAAIGLGHMVWFLGFVCAIGVLMGAEPLIARAVGAGRLSEARDAYGTAMWLAVALSAPLALLALVGTDLSLALAQPAELEGPLRDYLSWMALAALPTLLFQAMGLGVAAVGWSRPLLRISLAGNLVNIVANVVFVHGLGPIPALGVRGIAFATVASSLVMLALLAHTVARAPQLEALRGRWRRPSRRGLRASLAIGVPVGIQYGLEVAGFSVATLLMGTFGPAALAAHQVALTVVSVSFTVALGVGAAAGIRVAQASGARDAARVRRTGLQAFGVASAAAAAAATVIVLARGGIADLFQLAGEARAVATSLLAMAAIFQVADAVQAAAFGVLRGLGDTRVPLLFNVVGYWVIGLPLGAWLALRVLERPEPIWAGLTLALFLVAAAAFARFLGQVRALEG